MFNTYNDYINLRHEKPDLYYQTDTQRQMLNDQVRVGSDEFFNMELDEWLFTRLRIVTQSKLKAQDFKQK